MAERGIDVYPSALYRWVQAYAPEIDKRSCPYFKNTGTSWRVDETWIKIKGLWKYLYRAIDKEGQTLDFILSAKRNKKAAKRFFMKILCQAHTRCPRVIGVDKNSAYPPALAEIKKEKQISSKSKLRQVRYLNNRLEADHRFVKRRIHHKQWFQTFKTAAKTLAGYEAINMIRKGQVRYVMKNDIFAQNKFIESLFRMAA